MEEALLWKNLNNDAKAVWHPPQPFEESIKRQMNRLPYNRMRYKRKIEKSAASRRRRGVKERRDLYEQLEGFAML